MLKKYFTREVKIGILAVTATALLLYGLNFLKGVNVFKPTNYYYATFSNIDGLVETAPIFIKGHQVGQIRDISYDFTKETSFVVTLDIDKELQLPQGTRAELFDNGMLGGKAIRIVYSPQSTAFIPVGDTLTSLTVRGLMAYVSEDLLPKVDRLVSTTDSLIRSVKEITSGNEIKNTLSSIEQMSSNLEQSAVQLKSVMQHDVPGIVKNVHTITNDFAQVSTNMKGIDFAKTAQGIDATMLDLQQITQKMNSKEGSLGLLINDRSFYDNLNQTTTSANQLVIDLKENPKRYVHFSLFGGKK